MIFGRGREYNFVRSSQGRTTSFRFPKAFPVPKASSGSERLHIRCTKRFVLYPERTNMIIEAPLQRLVSLVSKMKGAGKPILHRFFCVSRQYFLRSQDILKN